MQIKLLLNDENARMLYEISEKIGGKINTNKNKGYIVWYATNKSDLLKVFSVFTRYPLLTVKSQYQLQFAKNCLLEKYKDINSFLVARNNKYNEIILLYKYNSENTIRLPLYFSPWLSGFIEAKGKYSSKQYYFSESSLSKCYCLCLDNNESHISDLIILYFNTSASDIIFNIPKKDITINIVSPKSRDILYKHLENYPLLGVKINSSWTRDYSNVSPLY